MKIWLDDCREAPLGWVPIRTAEACIVLLDGSNGLVSHLHLDHDLGKGKKTGYDVAKFIEKKVFSDDSYQPPVMLTHTSNPAGRISINQCIERIQKQLAVRSKMQSGDTVRSECCGSGASKPAPLDLHRQKLEPDIEVPGHRASDMLGAILGSKITGIRSYVTHADSDCEATMYQLDIQFSNHTRMEITVEHDPDSGLYDRIRVYFVDDSCDNFGCGGPGAEQVCPECCQESHEPNDLTAETLNKAEMGLDLEDAHGRGSSLLHD